MVTETQKVKDEKSFNKERFDAFMKLADFRLQRWINRRQLEWRISLGLWAAMLAAIKFMPLPNVHVCYTLLLLGFAVIWYIGWIKWHFDKSDRDIKRAFVYVEKAEDILGVPNLDPPSGGWWVCVLQILATILIAATAAFYAVATYLTVTH